MLGVVLGAIRARRAQAAILFALTALAVGTATAAPWYVSATARSVALARVDSAPPASLVVRAVGIVVKPAGAVPSGAILVDLARGGGSAAVSVPGAATTASLRLHGTVTGPAAQAGVTLAHRERSCAHVVVDGACPAAPGEAMLTRRTAELLRVGTGDSITFTPDNTGTVGKSAPAPLRVVGIYQLRDPLGDYWALSDLGTVTGNESSASADTAEPIFVAPDTLAALPPQELTADYHLSLPRAAFLGDDGYDLAADLRRQGMAVGDRWRVETSADGLARRVADEQRLLNLGVSIAAAQLLLLAWLALFFAARHTAEQRRADLGLLKLRGSTRWRVFTLAVAQSALPMLAGALVGLAAGAVAARLLAGDIGDPGRARTALLLSAAAAGTAAAGALAAAVVADARAMGSGVLDLLRHVPPRRRGWRADVVDLITVVIAVAGLYEAYSTDPGPGEASGLVLLAPTLIAVVVALVAARALGPLGARVGRGALRAGRLPTVLTATQLARRPGTHRVFALLTVAVAVFATAVSGWSDAAGARDRRAAHEVGADRVLTVQVRNRAQLLAAVRAVDPQGRYAMAVVRNNAGGTGQAMLAVDSSRFARVIAGAPEYRPTGGTDLVSLLRPALPTPITVPDGELTLDVTTVGAGPPLLVIARLVAGDGTAVEATFGPLTAGRGDARATVTGCGSGPGCRLVGFDLAVRTRTGELAAAPPGRGVRLYALTGSTAAGLTDALLRDPRRWRSTVVGEAAGAVVAPGPEGLTVLAPGEQAQQIASTRAYVIDAPVPVPVIRTGPPPPIARLGDPRVALFGVDPLPVRVMATTDALPQIQQRGYLVDLEYADRLVPAGGTGDTPEVWLNRDAPANLVERLRQEGLTILATDSIEGAADRLDRQGPPSALRFQLVAAVIGLLLAVGALAIAAAVERPDRTAELAALRVQGLPTSAVRRVAYGGYLLLVAVGLLLGVGAAGLAEVTVRSPMPYFSDDWHLLPLPSGLAVGPLALAALGGLLVFGPAAVAASAQLVRAVATRTGVPGPPRRGNDVASGGADAPPVPEEVR